MPAEAIATRAKVTIHAVFFNALLTAGRTVDDIIPAHHRAALAKMSGKLTDRLTVH